MNEELYKIMKDVYARWPSGNELSEVIKVIRQEIEAERERNELEEQFERIKKKLGK